MVNRKAFSAYAVSVVNRRSGYQHIPDGDLHSGTDYDLCAKDFIHFYHASRVRKLDYDRDCRLYVAAIFDVQYLCEWMMKCD